MSRIVQLWRTTTFRLTALFIVIFVVFSVLLLAAITYQSSIQIQQAQAKDIDREVAQIERIDRERGFRASILGRQVLSPKGLERKLGLAGGDIMHGNMTLDQLWSARPVLGHGNYRGPVGGLYMCGAGAHPGGGVTGAPGHNCAQVVIGDGGSVRRFL